MRSPSSRARLFAEAEAVPGEANGSALRPLPGNRPARYARREVLERPEAPPPCDAEMSAAWVDEILKNPKDIRREAAALDPRDRDKVEVWIDALFLKIREPRRRDKLRRILRDPGAPADAQPFPLRPSVKYAGIFIIGSALVFIGFTWF